MMKAYRDPRFMGTAFTATDDSFWPNSAVAAWRPGRRLSGDKLPTGPGRRDVICGLEALHIE
jgi:hypothetical protein